MVRSDMTQAILFDTILGAGLTEDKQHFFLHVTDASGNEARIALPSAQLQRFAQIGVELHAMHTRETVKAFNFASETIKFT
jgi:hypothetical protein